MRTVGLCLGIVLAASMAAAAPDGTAVKRISTEGFAERLHALAVEQAHPYEKGFVRSDDTYVCDNGADARAQRGVAWMIELNQKTAVPIAASAWAKSESQEGGAGPDFSLYLDLEYCDGTPLWGQSSAFETDADAGWHRREVVVTPDKPIRRVHAYLLFRNRKGLARFKDMRFGELSADGALRFDGALAEQALPPERGFLIRDVARESGFVAIGQEALGVRLSARSREAEGATFYDVSLVDRTGKDRALTLVYTLPLPTGGLTWFHPPRRADPLEGVRSEVLNATRHPVGANGLLSRYPFGAVAAAGRGRAVGLDPATPLVFRVGCQPQTRELYLACDIGLAPEKPEARFRFCVFDFDAAEAFRGAWVSTRA